MNGEWKVWLAACAMVVAMIVYSVPLGRLEAMSLTAAGRYYNLLVQGFRSGHLSVNKEAPPGFARLADPYDPDANRPYRILPHELSDLSYYKGRLYLYFGVTPALILYWPFVVLTGHYLFDRQAVTIFCALGVLASVGLLCALWRRYFFRVSAGIVVACALALGLATGVPLLLPRSDIYQVAISCGYMLTMLAVGGLWCSLHDTKRGWRWLAAASLAYGLAVAARPNLCVGAVALLVPVVEAWRERRRCGPLLLAAIVPLLLIGLGLMLYNALRFDNPLEFGGRYQLGGTRQTTLQFFGLRYFWFNFRVYFFKPAHWSARVPFVHPIAMPTFPAGYFGADGPFGILTNVPLVWLSLAVPLAWSNGPAHTRGPLCWFAVALALLSGTCALFLSFYCYSAYRYEVDFLPSLMLLAVMGILGLEHTLADQPRHRVSGHVVHWGWGLLLGFSVVFNSLVSIVNYAETACGLGTMLVDRGRISEAIQVFERALRVVPDYVDGHCNLGIAFARAGMLDKAIREFDCALRLKPDYVDAHINLGTALSRAGDLAGAMQHYEAALRANPNSSVAHFNLGDVLYGKDCMAEAREEFERALEIWPEFPEAHNSLGSILLSTGSVQAAIAHFEQALQVKPDYPQAHYNLGIALAQTGRLAEAIAQWQEVLWLKPDDAVAHYNVGIALQRAGLVLQAIKQFERTLELRPDFTDASNALARLRPSR
jgi:tetratricopeptide (TPR) repeat protein